MTYHARQRALERYEIEIDVDLIASEIRSNKAEMMHRISKQKAIYRVAHQGQKILVLYHRRKQIVITVLPHDHFPEWRAL